MQIPFSVIKSWLCRVARLTEVPARVTLSKTAVGGQGAGAADLDFDIPQDRFFFFRWVFEGHRPAGELDGRADLLPEGEVVDFDNSTVDIKVVLPSSGVDRADLFDDLLEIGEDRIGRDDLEAQLPQQVEASVMGGKRLPFDLLDVEDKDRELPFGRYLRVFLPEAAGSSGVSGVFKGLFLIFQLVGDQLLENAEVAYTPLRAPPGTEAAG